MELLLKKGCRFILKRTGCTEAYLLFIADSMPDHWGHLVFSQWANAHNINMKNITVLDRLAYIGRRGMGALEFMPPTSAEMETSFKVEIDQLSNLAQTMLTQAKDFKAQLSPRLDCGKPFQSRNFGRRSEAQSFNQHQSRIGGNVIPDRLQLNCRGLSP